MASPYRMFRDADGRLRIEAAAGGSAVVADFLFTDVREDKAHCAEIVESIEHARRGEPCPEHIGNIYALILGQAGARLENIHDESAPSAEIGLDELQSLLEAWRGHLA